MSVETVPQSQTCESCEQTFPHLELIPVHGIPAPDIFARGASYVFRICSGCLPRQAAPSD